jgi:adenylate kinase
VKTPRKKVLRLVLTGTPGTGKTSIARAIAKKTGAKLIDANALVKRGGLWANRAKREADLAALKKEILREIKASLAAREGFVAEGHLLCEFRVPCDACVVLRCEPRVLSRRLKARGYARRKIAENVLCEILDYCLVRSERAYGARAGARVIQVDATRRATPQKILAAVRAIRAVRRARSAEVDWTPLLLNKRFKNGLGLS